MTSPNSSSKTVIKFKTYSFLCLVKLNSSFLNTKTCLTSIFVKKTTLAWSTSLVAQNKMVSKFKTGTTTISNLKDTSPSKPELVVRFFILTFTKSRVWVRFFLRILIESSDKLVLGLKGLYSRRQRFRKSVSCFTMSAKVMKKRSKDFWSSTNLNWSILTTWMHQCPNLISKRKQKYCLQSTNNAKIVQRRKLRYTILHTKLNKIWKRIKTYRNWRSTNSSNNFKQPRMILMSS